MRRTNLKKNNITLKKLSRVLFHERVAKVLISKLLRLELVAVWDLVNKQIQIKAITFVVMYIIF